MFGSGIDRLDFGRALDPVYEWFAGFLRVLARSIVDAAEPVVARAVPLSQALDLCRVLHRLLSMVALVVVPTGDLRPVAVRPLRSGTGCRSPRALLASIGTPICGLL
jgi:hypothetical protein